MVILILSYAVAFFFLKKSEHISEILIHGHAECKYLRVQH